MPPRLPPLPALLLGACASSGGGELEGGWYDEPFGSVEAALWLEPSRATWSALNWSSYGEASPVETELGLPQLLVSASPTSCRSLQRAVDAIGEASEDFLAAVEAGAPLSETCGTYDVYVSALTEAGVDDPATPPFDVEEGQILTVEGAWSEAAGALGAPDLESAEIRGVSRFWQGPGPIALWDADACDTGYRAQEGLTLIGRWEITSVDEREVALSLDAELWSSCGSECDPAAGAITGTITARRCAIEAPTQWLY